MYLKDAIWKPHPHVLPYNTQSLQIFLKITDTFTRGTTREPS